jgi:hypothetical protein
MFGIFSKIKIIVAGIVAALLPILYIIGRRDGAKVEEVKQVKASAKAAENRAEFYKEMETTNNEIESNKPRTRDDLTDRLRDNGL